ncbi:MAG TPA: ABC transporter permease [Chloroflexi bacterium]|nr:MAG: ABC transporter permease [Chloroflexota bacterium]HDD55710.1 ABC transporter permease [Chloroflexota bacterium]
MRAFLKYTWVEIKLFLREPMGAFFTLVFPLVMLFLFGTIYGNEPDAMFNGYGTVDISIPAYTAMIISTTGIMALSITMSAYREKGILRRLRLSPLQPHVILAGQVVVIFMMTLAGMLLLILAGKLVYDLRFDGRVLDVALAFLLGSVSFFSLGFVLASVMPNARTAQVVGMVIFYPMLFLSGAGMPLEILPESIRNFSKYLPLTHVVTMLRGLWIGESWSLHTTEIWVLLGMTLAGVVISSLTFRWE